MQTIGDILADREVFFVKGDQTVKTVVDFLCERRIGAVPVKDGEEVIGVFSERDVLYRVVHKGLDPNKVFVRDAVSKEFIKVLPEEDYRVTKANMIDQDVRYAVCVDENDELLGIVSMRHLVRVDVQEYAHLVARLNDRYYQNALKQN